MSHRLQSTELLLVRLPLVRPFTTSSHTKDHLDHILIRVRDEDGREGWGECASASDPYYCSETSETSWHILRDFLVPGLLGVSWEQPDEAARTWAKVRGNNFDANSAYSIDNPEHVAALRALDDLKLMMIEQPLADDDIVDHARLQAQLRTPICLDESIHSVHDARKALDLGSCRVINVKVSRLGGLSEARRVHDLCASRGIPVWCGGMHEFGIGRAANVAICSLPGFTLPGDVSGSDKYYREDIVDPPVHAHAGAIDVPWDRPGLGFDASPSRIRANTIRDQVLEAERAPLPA